MSNHMLNDAVEAANKAVDAPENMPLTMAVIWEELTPDERAGVCRCCGTDSSQGVLALTAISKVLKMMYYRSNYVFYPNPGQSAFANQQYYGAGTASAIPSHSHPMTPPYQAGSAIGGVVTGNTTFPTTSVVNTSPSIFSSLANAMGIRNGGKGTP